MKLSTAMAVVGWIVFCLSACGGVSDKTCASNDDCVDGLICDTDSGECVDREPLSVVTQSLPDATVGVAYRTTLQASGGIAPYKWYLDYKPEWLMVGEESGELSGTPDAPGSDLAVGIRVTDASAGGQVDAQLLISVLTCVDGIPQACHVVEGGKCLVGNQLCADGEWGECTNLTHSAHVDHCGPECGACDPLLADACYLGSCTCGQNPACAAGQVCCLQACADVQTDDANCGACGANCVDEILNATNPHCEQGRCDYDACGPAHLDVDGDRSNGCEVERGVENCAFAGESCEAVVQNATGLACVSDPVNGDYHCDFAECVFGFLDCDDRRHNGCEVEMSDDDCGECGLDCNGLVEGEECVLDQDDQQQDVYHCGCIGEDDCLDADTQQCCGLSCVPQDSDSFCGDCTTDCGLSPLGPRCVDAYFHTCGCLDVSECDGLGALCCDLTCTGYTEQHCGQCFRECDAFDHGGSICDVDAGSCYCLDDAECNDFAGSQRTCSGVGVEARCGCGDGADCQGTSESQCCDTRDGPECVNLMSDPEHCGRCGVECGQGMQCEGGRCSCSTDLPNPVPCPADSSATNCQSNVCTCNSNPSGVQPCAQGRVCCNGSAGGMGGPNSGADEGCCWNPCGSNAPGDCLY